MNKITCLSKKLKEFFNEKAEKISITTRFIKRKRKLKGSSFVKAMVLGNIGVDNCSVETMCQLLNEDSIDIALFTIIRTDRNMLLACYSHKHISYRIRTIIRKAI